MKAPGFNVSSASILDAVENTPIVQLHRVVPRGSARVLAKLEFANPPRA